MSPRQRQGSPWYECGLGRDTHQITVQDLVANWIHRILPKKSPEAEGKLGHIGTYTLNVLPRWLCQLSMCLAAGTKAPERTMTSGDYRIGIRTLWLAQRRCRIFTDPTRLREIKATQSTEKTGLRLISYLGTMSNRPALRRRRWFGGRIAETGISSWYNYYHENGLVTSPGGYPGEILNPLTSDLLSQPEGWWLPAS